MPGGLVSFQAPFRPVASSLPQNFRPVAPGIQGVAPQPGNPAPRMPSFGGGGGFGGPNSTNYSGTTRPISNPQGGAAEYNLRMAAWSRENPQDPASIEWYRRNPGVAGNPAQAGGAPGGAGGFQVPQGMEAAFAPILAQLERDRAGINESSLERGLFTSDVP